MAVFKPECYEDSTDEWATPRHIVDPLSDAVGGFDLDPASGAENAPHATHTYTESDDGLHQPWFGAVWCNPPYSDKIAWIAKAHDAVRSGDAQTVVMVLPVDTSTQWFHRLVVGTPVICFVEGRISFGYGDGSPNFAQMLVAFGDTPDALQDALADLGTVYTDAERHEPLPQNELAEYLDDS